jgi:hypothetical protein
VLPLAAHAIDLVELARPFGKALSGKWWFTAVRLEHVGWIDGVLVFWRIIRKEIALAL